MLLGLDAHVWQMLLVVLLFPVIAVGLLHLLLRKRGGLSPGWGCAMVVALSALTAVLIILDKIKL